MKRIERFVEVDPCVEWEEKLLKALADVLESVPDEEAQFALAAFEDLGVRVYDTRLLGAKRRLQDLSPSP
jgi:hypothetical protein